MEKENTFIINGKSIIVPLKYKGYAVRANIIRVSDTEFQVTLEITCAGYTRFDRIEGDVFTIHSEKNVNWDTYYFVKDKFAEGYFKPYIDRYNAEMTAMNKGFDLLEEEAGANHN